MSTINQGDNRPSEFGGRPGLIQSVTDGHQPTVSERAYQLRQTDPSPARVNGAWVADDAAEIGESVS